MVKLSLYNIILPHLSDEDNIYIYNAKTGAIVILEKRIYQNLCDADSICPFEEYIPGLLNQGILVVKEKDELQEILFEMKSRQYKRSGMLSLVIAPTLHCNYKCIYCFEEGQLDKKIMNEDVVNSILDYVSNYVDKFSDIHKLRIQWFGGEPLLAYEDVIKPLSRLLINYSNEKNIEYESGIMTNGYLLNEDIIIQLIDKCLIRDFQITFDGRKDNYNRMKCPPSNAYEIVKNNVLFLSEYIENVQQKIKVNIRINIDKTNARDAELFVQELRNDKRFKDNLRFYLGRVRGTSDSLGVHEFECFEDEFNKFIHRKPLFIYPRKIWCNQYTYNSFCIGPCGELYKCEHDFGHQDRVIGDLKNGLYYNEYLTSYMNQTVNESCRKCKIFPICLAGCPNQKFHSADNHSCEFTIDKVIQRVEEYVRMKRNKCKSEF